MSDNVNGEVPSKDSTRLELLVELADAERRARMLVEECDERLKKARAKLAAVRRRLNAAVLEVKKHKRVNGG